MFSISSHGTNLFSPFLLSCRIPRASMMIVSVMCPPSTLRIQVIIKAGREKCKKQQSSRHSEVLPRQHTHNANRHKGEKAGRKRDISQYVRYKFFNLHTYPSRYCSANRCLFTGLPNSSVKGSSGCSRQIYFIIFISKEKLNTSLPDISFISM